MKTLIAGNWKMNLTPAEAVILVDGIRAGMASMPDNAEVLVCPPFVSLSAVNARVAGTRIQLGAQNMHPETKGAFTGEISPNMLVAAGCSHVLCGHSERRHIFNETDEFINRKLRSALQNDLIPVLCCGETLQEREKGLTFNVVERHIRAGLNGVSDEQGFRVVVAYEPVWAIGTGKTASPEQAQEVHAEIRQLLIKLFPQSGETIRILYGGSVKPENVDGLLNQADINGALVGGASLKIDSFLSLIRAGNFI